VAPPPQVGAYRKKVNGVACGTMPSVLSNPMSCEMEGSVARKLTDGVQLKLRFDERLRRRLAKEAENNKQSMNAEIIGRLEESFRRQDAAEQAEVLVSEAAKVASKEALDRFREFIMPYLPNLPTDKGDKS